MPHGAIPYPFGNCRICNDKATGVHYGVATCEGCKGFYKRSTLKGDRYKCFFGGQCELTPKNRNRCKACRYQRCIDMGMSVDAVKMGRIPKMDKERALAEAKHSSDSSDPMESDVTEPSDLNSDFSFYSSSGPSHCQSTNVYSTSQSTASLQSKEISVFSGNMFPSGDIARCQLKTEMATNINGAIHPSTAIKQLVRQVTGSHSPLMPKYMKSMTPSRGGYVGENSAGNPVGGQNSVEPQPMDCDSITSMQDQSYTFVKQPTPYFPEHINFDFRTGDNKALVKSSCSYSGNNLSVNFPQMDFSSNLSHQIDPVTGRRKSLAYGGFVMPNRMGYDSMPSTISDGSTFQAISYNNAQINSDANVQDFNTYFNSTNPKFSQAGNNGYQFSSQRALPVSSQDPVMQLADSTSSPVKSESPGNIAIYENPLSTMNSGRRKLLEETLEKLKVADQKHNARIRELVEQMKDEIYGRRPVHDLNIIKKSTKSQVVFVWEDLFRSIPTNNNIVMGLCRDIPGFNGLNPKDQAVLMEEAYFDIWMIQNSVLFYDGDSYLRLPCDARYSRWWMQHFLPKPLVDSIFKNIAQLNACRLSTLELTILCAIQLTNPDHTGLSNISAVKALHDHYLDVLAYEVQRTHNANHSRILIDIFRILPQFGPINVQQAQVIGNFRIDSPPEGCLMFCEDGEADIPVESTDVDLERILATEPSQSDIDSASFIFS